MLEARLSHSLSYDFGDSRPGDQPVYVGDIRRAASHLDWAPTIDPTTGVGLLFDWVEANQELIRNQIGRLLSN